VPPGRPSGAPFPLSTTITSSAPAASSASADGTISSGRSRVQTITLAGGPIVRRRQLASGTTASEPAARATRSS